MPVIQSPGISSGIDINGLVAQLVAAERAPAEQRLNRQQAKVDARVSALGQLRGALSTLQSTLTPLRTVSAFQARSATSSDRAVLEASATGSAAQGSYSIEVDRLASAQRLASAAFAGGSDSAVGTGTLTLSLGTASFQVTLGEGSQSLAALRDAINAATDNPGIQASIITAADGARLILASQQTGAASTIRVTASGGDGGLDALVYDPGNATNLTQLTAAEDARVLIEGFEVTSATNSITGAIDGVTLNLLAADPGSVKTLTISNDTTQALEKIRKFVTDFNTAATTMAKLRAFDPATRVGGPLLGDAMLRGIESSLRREISTPVAAAAPPFDTLAGIGITTNSDGTLKLDETKLSNALRSGFDVVGRLFGSENGVAARLYGIVDTTIRADGQVTTRTERLQRDKRSIEQDRVALDRRMESVERRYRAQFIAMDTLLSQLQSTGTYLSQQLTQKSG
jgi:flagellar hook-associated protein 2